MKDPIIYSQLRNNFSQISNFALLDTELSAKAYKLYAYMCYRIGLSTSWQFNKSEILKHFREGESAMRSAFNELIDRGFLERKRVRNDKGIFERTDYTIYAEPVNKGSNPQVENPRVDKPPVENSREGKPHVENQQHINKEGINKDSNNKDLYFFPNPKTAAESEIEFYKKEKKYLSDVGKFFTHWQKFDWKDKGKKIQNRYAAFDEWEKKYLEMNPQKEIIKTAATLPQKENPKITAIRDKIKQEIGKVGPHADWMLFGKIEEKDGYFVIEAKSDKALQYREVLEEINVKIELK